MKARNPPRSSPSLAPFDHAAVGTAAACRPRHGAGRRRRSRRWIPERARRLYVSKDPKDHGARRRTSSGRSRRRRRPIAATRRSTKGVVDFTKVKYRSSVGDLDVPAYLFQPLQKRGAKGHAALVWVHGGVHGDWVDHDVAVRQGSGRSRLRGHLSRVPRQHRLRPRPLHEDRLRRLRSGRRR